MPCAVGLPEQEKAPACRSPGQGQQGATLAGLAGPLVVLLALQFTLAILFAIFICFRILGRTYDAAVVSGGFMGIAIGATPTAMANITAITQRYGASHLAFLVVPLVGAFFVDIANALIIQFFLAIL